VRITFSIPQVTKRRGHHPCFGDLSPGVTQMLDIIMLAMGLGFFALSVGYAYACDRL
jgi:hypothetical protein